MKKNVEKTIIIIGKIKKMRTKQFAYQLSNRRRRTFRYWHGSISQK